MFSGITLKQISTKSGYSISTVSKALNDQYEIKDSTKRKIRKIAEKNNYVPNSAARALRNKRTNIIAVVVPQITTPYFNNFIGEVQMKASTVGYRIMISQSFNELQKEKENIIQLNDGTVDGVLILSNNQFSHSDFKRNALENVLVVPFQAHEGFNKETLKDYAINSFDNILSLIRINNLKTN